MIKKPIQKLEKAKYPREVCDSSIHVSNYNQSENIKNTTKGKLGNIRSHATIKLKSTSTEIKEIEDKPHQNKFPRDPSLYLQIPEIPVYEATMEEFKQPLLLMKKLREQGYEKFGCIKIKPPTQWDPDFALSNLDKKITTRIQNLNELIRGEVKFFEKVKPNFKSTLNRTSMASHLKNMRNLQITLLTPIKKRLT